LGGGGAGGGFGVTTGTRTAGGVGFGGAVALLVELTDGIGAVCGNKMSVLVVGEADGCTGGGGCNVLP
jgi:hypothetical protein